MAKAQEAVSKYHALLTSKEHELLLQREAVWKFVSTEHDAKTTEEYQIQVRKSALDVSGILRSLLEAQDTGASFRAEAEALCQRCRFLEIYTRDMEKCLADDLVNQYRKQDKESVDVAKNVGLFFGIVGFFIAAQKSGVADGVLNVNQAAEAGGIVGVLALSHKKIKSAFVAAGKLACGIPQRIEDNMTYYYVRETVREKTIATINNVLETKKRVGQGTTSAISYCKETGYTISGKVFELGSITRRSVMRKKKDQSRQP